MAIASVLDCSTSMAQPLEEIIKVTLKYIRLDDFYYPMRPLQINGKECKTNVYKMMTTCGFALDLKHI